MAAAQTPSPAKAEDKIDLRKQLFNGQKVGPIQAVQMPREAITSLHSVMYDIDPDNFRPDVASGPIRRNPQRFHKDIVEPMLRRNAVLSRAEVRNTGRGLHVIVRFAEPVTFDTDGDRRRWAAIVKMLQCALPADPNAPGITAVTRAIGSVNSKTGRRVERIAAGEPVPVGDVLELYGQLRDRPFATIMGILLGSDQVRPCPVCRTDGSGLGGFDRAGMCYKCGPVSLAKLYDVFLTPTAGAGGPSPAAGEEEG